MNSTTLYQLYFAFVQFCENYRREQVESGIEFDGRAFWQPWKKLFTVPTNFKLTYEESADFKEWALAHDDWENDQTIIGLELNEMYHFACQLYRIPRDANGSLSMVKLMQFGLNFAQYYSVNWSADILELPLGLDLISTDDWNTPITEFFDDETIKQFARIF